MIYHTFVELMVLGASRQLTLAMVKKLFFTPAFHFNDLREFFYLLRQIYTIKFRFYILNLRIFQFFAKFYM